MISRIGWLAAVLWLALSVTSIPSQAQLETNLGGLSDANVEGYMAPLSTGMAGTMSSAIFRTGDVPKTGLTFSVGAAAMAIGFGDEDKTYKPTYPVGFEPMDPGQKVPTVVGDYDGAVVEGESGTTYFPGGFGMDGFEIVVPEATVGAVAGTQLKLRWIAIDLGNSDIGKFEYVGVGGQHSISQWIPTLPVDVAAGLFFQSFDIGDNLVNVNSWHFNVTGSRQFGVVQPYVGLGFDSLKMDVDVEDSDGTKLVDVSLDSENNAHLTLGAAAKIPSTTVFFEFNAAAATGFSLGLAFGI